MHNNIYQEILTRNMKFKKHKKIEDLFVRHRQTCPCCNKKMSNVYSNDRKNWKCKKCIERIVGNE